AALELMDEVGFDELTMRRLAQRVGGKAASLYRHVRDKEELLVFLSDLISGEISLVGSAGTWRGQLTESARDVRRALPAHRDAARLLAITAPFGPRRLRHIESVLRVLRAAGLRGRDAARVAYHCNNFVTEFVADEARFEAFASAPGLNRQKLFAHAREQFKSLPPAEYPTIVELAHQLSEDDADGLFQFGLEVWLRAIEGLAKRSK